MKQHFYLLLLFFFLLSITQSKAQYYGNIAYTENFKSESGIYGTVSFKIHPFTFGIGTLKAQASSIRILGVSRNDYNINDLNMDFPIDCRKCTFEATGVGEFNIGREIYKGDFAFTGNMNSINITQAEFVTVDFSSLAKAEHNKQLKEQGVSLWVKRGHVKSIRVFNVKGDKISEIEKLINGNIRKAKELALKGDKANNRAKYEMAVKFYKESYALDRNDQVNNKLRQAKIALEEQQGNSEKAQKLIAEANKLIDDKDYHQGIRIYQKAYSLTKDDGILSRIKFAEKLIKEEQENDDRYEALLTQGAKYMNKKDYPNAITSFIKASKIKDTPDVNNKIRLAENLKERKMKGDSEERMRKFEEQRKENEAEVERQRIARMSTEESLRDDARQKKELLKKHGDKMTAKQRFDLKNEIIYGENAGDVINSSSSQRQQKKYKQNSDQYMAESAVELGQALGGLLEMHQEKAKERQEKRERKINRQIKEDAKASRKKNSTEIVGDYGKDGLVVKRKGFYYGYIDRNGKWIIKPKYLKAGPFKNGIAKVQSKSGKVKYLNTKGKKIR